MTELVAKNLHVDGRLIDVDFRLAPGELVAIVGPNGSGKSSLLRVLAGLLPVGEGAVSLTGAALKTLDHRQRARLLAYLPQRAEIAWPIAVADMVMLGRYAFGDPQGARDAATVERLLGEVGSSHLARRSTATLSGGELALVALARVFAAETPLLLLDEPTAALDPRRQIETMGRLVERSRRGQGIAVVLHDLNLAAQFADRIVWMKDGRIAAEAPPSAEDLETNAALIFDVAVRIETSADGRISGLAIRSDNPPG